MKKYTFFIGVFHEFLPLSHLGDIKSVMVNLVPVSSLLVLPDPMGEDTFVVSVQAEGQKGHGVDVLDLGEVANHAEELGSLPVFPGVGRSIGSAIISLMGLPGLGAQAILVLWGIVKVFVGKGIFGRVGTRLEKPVAIGIIGIGARVAKVMLVDVLEAALVGGAKILAFLVGFQHRKGAALSVKKTGRTSSRLNGNVIACLEGSGPVPVSRTICSEVDPPLITGGAAVVGGISTGSEVARYFVGSTRTRMGKGDLHPVVAKWIRGGCLRS